MGKIGIIANPSSGKDIRRLVGQALVIGRREKVNIIKRVLIGAYAVGVREFCIMPDVSQIGEACIQDLQRQYPDLVKGVAILEMDVDDSTQDSILAAERFRQAGMDCIVTLGGDGTVRAASKGSGQTPLLPISTGTNNVIPAFIEGTIAGMAAGFFSQMPRHQKSRFVKQHKNIELWVNGEVVDLALVDLVVLRGRHLGSKAVWDPGQLLQVAVTRASPLNIGFSAIVGQVKIIDPGDPIGASLRITKSHATARKIPIGPGMIAEISIDCLQDLIPGQPIPLAQDRPIVIALDGERQIVLGENDQAEILLNLTGPSLVDLRQVLEHQTQHGNNTLKGSSHGC